MTGKKLVSALLINLITMSLTAQIKDSILHIESDPQSFSPTGFGWGGTPILAYDADLGLRYGAAINLFDYGKQSHYPNYRQFAKLKLFRSTKGTTHLSGYYESNKLINGLQIQAEATWIKDTALDFFGFNGTQTITNPDYINPEHQDYINKHYYQYHRTQARIRANFLFPIKETGSLLFFGVSYNQYLISDLENETLYSNLKDWNAIDADEINGGKIPTISLGYIYDTRNNKLNCKDGLWAETYLVHSPSLLSESSFTKHIATIRYYHHLFKPDITATFRISSQQRLHGKIPLYALNTFYETRQNQDGIGGAFTQRGIGRNRIVSDGFVLLNAEMRKTVSQFELAKLHCQFDVSLFTDLSYITQEYQYNDQNIPETQHSKLISREPQNINITFGPGLYFIYNSNNIISFNLGYSPNEQLGKIGIYVGSSLLF